MTAPPAPSLSRRERQIMDLLYERGPSTAAEIQEAIPDAPSYSAIRALMRILETKGHVRHKTQGPRYVFSPTVNADQAKGSAVKHLLRTFFNGNAGEAVAALLDASNGSLSKSELDRMAALIEKARKEGK